MKMTDSRMPRIVQAASMPGIVSRKVPLNCLAIGGGAPWPSMILLLAGVEEEDADQEVDAGEDQGIDDAILPAHSGCRVLFASVLVHSALLGSAILARKVVALLQRHDNRSRLAV
jgi:hypothetical protein